MLDGRYPLWVRLLISDYGLRGDYYTRTALYLYVISGFQPLSSRVD